MVRDYAKVKHGSLSKSSGGLTADKIGRSKYSGKFVSKARQAHGRRMYRENNLAAYQAPPFEAGGSPIRRRRTTRRRRPAAKKPAAKKVGWW